MTAKNHYKILSCAFLLLQVTFLMGQSPMAFSFQGIARDLSGSPLTNKTIGLEFALIQGNPLGPILYLESHQITTNDNALFNVTIGRGLARFGDVSDIDWSVGPFFMRTALDETGGENYTVVGTSELLSVPFALYALNSGSSSGQWKSENGNIYYDGNNIGIGTEEPEERLHISDGNLYLENSSDGIIMRSSNGNCWKQSVSNTGQTIWTAVSCTGSTINIAPVIMIVSPTGLSEYDDGAPVSFSASVTDADSPIQNIAITWSSNLDGELYSSFFDANGNSSFVYDELSQGVHNITAIARDSNGGQDSETTQVKVRGASLLLNPATLQYSVNQNQRSLFLQNTGDLDLTWVMTYPSPALTVSPSSGSLSPNESINPTVTIDRAFMSDGINEFEIELTTNQDITRTVTVRVDNTIPKFSPEIEIILPNSADIFSAGESVFFSADITDQDTPLPEIEVTWRSNIDGVLNTSKVGTNGNVSFSTTTLSKGFHSITATATDSDNRSDSQTIQVNTTAPAAITLLPPTKQNGNIVLNWTQYPNSDFLKYDIYRTDANCTEGNATFLAQINDISTTTYIDEMAPLEFQVCYFVVVTNSEGKTRQSNVETVDLPSGHIFNFVASDLLKHPTLPFVYLIDKGGQRLIKFDYNSKTIVSQTSIQPDAGFSDIADNGSGVEIAIPSRDGKVYIYSADNLALTQTIITDLAASCAVQDGNGNVIASVIPSPWWEDPIRTYARGNGINLDAGGERDLERLRKVPGRNEYLSISQGVSPTDMNFYEIDENGIIQREVDDQYHGTYSLDANLIRISDNGLYVITGRSGTVYLANSSMEYKGQLQNASLNFSDFAFSDDGSIIYAGTSNRRSIQVGEYPSLIRNSEILTKGFPVFIARSGNKLISLSKQNENSVTSGIEVIDL